MKHTRPNTSSFLVALLAITFATPSFAADDFAVPKTDEGLPGTGLIIRDGWFLKLWQNKRTAWAKRVQQDQDAVVFLGDSITQGWGDNLHGMFGDLKTANRGISGDTTRGVLIRLQQDVLSLNPKAIVILIGTNDLGRGDTPESANNNLKLILAAIKKHNAKTPVVLCAVMPSSASKRRPADKIKLLNTLYARTIWGDRQITMVDTWTLFADANGDAKKPEFPDLLHPNKIGYAKWAAGIKPILATLEIIETEADDFKLEPGFKSLFNGKNLDGWVIKKNFNPKRKPRPTKPGGFAWPVFKEDINLDGKTVSPDGRYAAINGRLVVTTPIEGRRFQQIYTQREFPNDFVLKLEFRGTPNADSGVFIRKPQLQCRDYALAGPYKDLKNYKEGEWNELVITVKGNVAHCTCNGEVIEAAFKLPDTGPIGLEGDRGQIEYRRIRVKETKNNNKPKKKLASVYSVNGVNVEWNKAGTLVIKAKGMVSSGGWGGAELDLVKQGADAWEFKMVASPPPPGSIVTQAFVNLQATFHVKDLSKLPKKITVRAGRSAITKEIPAKP